MSISIPPDDNNPVRNNLSKDVDVENKSRKFSKYLMILTDLASVSINFGNKILNWSSQHTNILLVLLMQINSINSVTNSVIVVEKISLKFHWNFIVKISIID